LHWLASFIFTANVPRYATIVAKTVLRAFSKNYVSLDAAVKAREACFCANEQTTFQRPSGILLLSGEMTIKPHSNNKHTQS
jgi:hypothetical protein